jgi:hypothetical protein
VDGAEHLLPYSGEVQNVWSYTSNPPLRPHGVVLDKYQGHLYLHLFETRSLLEELNAGLSVNGVAYV